VAARGEIRQFPAAQKLKAIMRAEEGEGVVPMLRKPCGSRKLLHDWITAWEAHGPEGVSCKCGRWTEPAER
jgi:transposase